jgi:glycosyltransferase involved in cell wall biosynthesis
MRSISIIITVLNEGESIRQLLDSLRGQSRQPDEIVLVDGGSSDDTLRIIAEYPEDLPLRVLQEPGSNISQGRNIAIAAAKSEIIAATDAGVRIPSDWLENLVEPFASDPETRLVAGFFLPDANPHSAFEVAMSATVLPLRDEIQPEKFLPSSRSVAFCKSAWEAVGGYPEWLDFSEDLIFDLRLKARFGDFVFAPDALVYFKPRTSLRKFFKQYYLYARGDGKANLWAKRHFARYITYLILIPLLAILALLVHPVFLLGYIVGGAVYLKQPYRRLPHLWGGLSFWGKTLSLFFVPIIRVLGDVAKMIGYVPGWAWRVDHNPPDWRKP